MLRRSNKPTTKEMQKLHIYHCFVATDLNDIENSTNMLSFLFVFFLKIAEASV